MATITAQAKLYQAFRLLAVDKNAGATISVSTSVTADVQLLKRTAAGLEAEASVTLTDERYVTYGGKMDAVANTSLSCSFPTYIRFDLDALGVPDGTDLVLQLEEGFVIEGDYPGTTARPLPFVANYMAFRTPKKFALYPTVTAAINYNIERIRPYSSDSFSLFSPNFIAVANRVGEINMSSAFNITPTLTYAPGFFRSDMEVLSELGANVGFLVFFSWGQSANFGIEIDTVDSKTTRITANIPVEFTLSISPNAEFSIAIQAENFASIDVDPNITASALSAIESQSVVDVSTRVDYSAFADVTSSATLLGSITYDAFFTSSMTSDTTVSGDLSFITFTRYATGDGADGALGNNATSRVYTLTELDTPNTWRSISMLQHALGLKSVSSDKSLNELWGWGDNNSYQLGLGDTTDRLVPTRIGTANNWKEVSAGSFHSLAINNSGELYAWGSNSNGATGRGFISGSTTTPTKIGSATNWLYVSAGPFFSLAINTDGELWAWGDNSNGQLGLNDTTQRTTPTRVGTATDWVSISAGGETAVKFSLAINSSGELYSWGSNGSGRTGLGLTSGNTLVPTQVGSDTDWWKIEAADYHSLALKTNGEMWSWGGNSAGATGQNTSTGNTTTPTQVGTSTDWIEIACGLSSSLAINDSQELYGFGSASVGTLGIGGSDASPPANQLVPVKVTNDTGWVFVATGSATTHALRK